MKKYRAVLLMLCVMLFGTAAYTRSGAETPAVERIFTDDCGREVPVLRDISAVVPSGALSQIALLAIAPEKIVGLADRWKDSARGIVPDAIFDLPCFGQLYSSADLNVEELAAAAPQLIVDVGEAVGTVAEDMDTLEEQTRIPSVHIEASLATMPEAFRKLGELLGKEEKGEALAAFCERVYARTLSIMDRVGDGKVSALYILGEDGLNVLAKGSYHAEVIDLLTDNLAAAENRAARGSGNEVSIEQITLWDPDLILFAPGSIFDTADERELWKGLSAIANGNYLEVPEGPYNWLGMPPGVQRVLGMIWLTAALYPGYCDYDVKTEVKEYFDLFCGCTLTDERYDAMTARAFIDR